MEIHSDMAAPDDSTWSASLALYIRKTTSFAFLFMAALSYTFSAMPSTVNFYRAIVPPLSTEPTKHQDPKIQAATAITTEYINVSQVFAVPSLLFMLEIISIYLAIEFWKLSKNNQDDLKWKILVLFLSCQIYPYASVVYQVADKEKSELNTGKKEVTTKEDTRASNSSNELTSSREELKELQKERLLILKMRQNELVKSTLLDVNIRIKELQKIITGKELHREGINSRTSIRLDTLKSSTIQYWIDNKTSPSMLVSYLLAALFPVVMLALGYLRARLDH